jgi:hypothetical protein
LIYKIDFELLFVVETILDNLMPIPTWDPEYCAGPLTLQDKNRVVSKNEMTTLVATPLDGQYVFRRISND